MALHVPSVHGTGELHQVCLILMNLEHDALSIVQVRYMPQLPAEQVRYMSQMSIEHNIGR